MENSVIKLEFPEVKLESNQVPQQSIELKPLIKENPIKIEEHDMKMVSTFEDCSVIAEKLHEEIKIEDDMTIENLDLNSFTTEDEKIQANESEKLEILKYHERANFDENPYQCCVCLKTFTSLNDLKFHTLCRCDKCSKLFTCLNSLEEHKIIHTEESDEQQLRCDICSKIGSRLKIHEVIQTNGKRILCAICHKKFIGSIDLRRNPRKMLDNKKEFSCSVCSRKYNSQSGLQYHEKKHIFSCNVCSKGFVTSNLLKEHKRFHTGEKPFRCDECLKTFRRLRDLKIHSKKNLKCSKQVYTPHLTSYRIALIQNNITSIQ